MKKFFMWGLMALAMVFVSCDEDDFKYDGDWFGTPEISNVTANTLKIKCTTSINESVLNGNQAGFKYVAIEGDQQGVFHFAKGEVSEGVMSADIKGLTSQTRYALYPIINFGTKVAEGQKVMATTLEGSDPTPSPDPDPTPTPEEKPTIATPTAPDAEITETSATLYCEVSYAGTETLSYTFLYRKVGEQTFKEAKASEAKSFSLSAEVLAAGSVKVKATITGLTDDTQYEYKLQVKAGDKTFESALVKFSTKKSQGGGEVTPTPSTPKGLMEMPEMQQKPGDYYYSTYMCDGNIEGKNMRNYSVCYSKDHRSTVWVAAPMHRCYMAGHYHRTDRWQPAPEKYGIPSSIQPNLKKSYKGNFSRGHLVASSDRHPQGASCDNINAQTFYYTNMCPQIQNGFNGGIWNQLEQAVQEWGMQCSDTLYVVSGAVYNGRETCSDNSGKKVDVPSHFYKVVIRSKSGKSGKGLWELPADQLECAGWYFEHKAYGNNNYSAVITTVEEVEKKSGMKFFVNIPNAPKSRLNKSFWN